MVLGKYRGRVTASIHACDTTIIDAHWQNFVAEFVSNGPASERVGSRELARHLFQMHTGGTKLHASSRSTVNTCSYKLPQDTFIFPCLFAWPEGRLNNKSYHNSIKRQ